MARRYDPVSHGWPAARQRAGSGQLFLSSLCFPAVVIATAFWGRQIEPPPIALAVPLARGRGLYNRFACRPIAPGSTD